MIGIQVSFREAMMTKTALALLMAMLVAVVGVAQYYPNSTRQPVFPDDYFVSCNPGENGVAIHLTQLGVEYGITTTGSCRIARYSLDQWTRAYNSRGDNPFIRKACTGDNSIAQEVYDHCAIWRIAQDGVWVAQHVPWLFPFVSFGGSILQDRANPINVNRFDKWPFWGGD